MDRSLEGWAFSVRGPKIRFGFWWKGGNHIQFVEFWGLEFRKPSVVATRVTRGALRVVRTERLEPVYGLKKSDSFFNRPA